MSPVSRDFGPCRPVGQQTIGLLNRLPALRFLVHKLFVFDEELASGPDSLRRRVKGLTWPTWHVRQLSNLGPASML